MSEILRFSPPRADLKKSRKKKKRMCSKTSNGFFAGLEYSFVKRRVGSREICINLITDGLFSKGR